MITRAMHTNLLVIATMFLMAACTSSSPHVVDRQLGSSEDDIVSLSGRVTSISEDAFILQHAVGLIAVEFDDWDRFRETSHLRAGDTVKVIGRVDKDLFESRSLEASTIYVARLDAYFFASPLDEESSHGRASRWNSSRGILRPDPSPIPPVR